MADLGAGPACEGTSGVRVSESLRCRPDSLTSRQR